jgi:hypothetical protein
VAQLATARLADLKLLLHAHWLFSSNPLTLGTLACDV